MKSIYSDRPVAATDGVHMRDQVPPPVVPFHGVADSRVGLERGRIEKVGNQSPKFGRDRFLTESEWDFSPESDPGKRKEGRGDVWHGWTDGWQTGGRGRAGRRIDRSEGEDGRGLTDGRGRALYVRPRTHSLHLMALPLGPGREICRLEGRERANKRSDCFRNRNSCSRSPN